MLYGDFSKMKLYTSRFLGSPNPNSGSFVFYYNLSFWTKMIPYLELLCLLKLLF